MFTADMVYLTTTAIRTLDLDAIRYDSEQGPAQDRAENIVINESQHFPPP